MKDCIYANDTSILGFKINGKDVMFDIPIPRVLIDKSFMKTFDKKISSKYTSIDKINDLLNLAKAKTNVRRYTPEKIESLGENEMFVFGSNVGGVHEKGTALDAKTKFGAIEDNASGYQGQSYAVITKKDWRVEKSSTLNEIQEEIRIMLITAKMSKDKTFLVTKLGSGLGGYTTEEIKKLFLNLKDYISDNVILPKEYEFRDDINIILSSNKTESTSNTTSNSSSILLMRNDSIGYTEGQAKALLEIANLIDKPKGGIYLLAGYAGTGKTTIAENIAKYADRKGKTLLILAPTNKAANVLNSKLESKGITAKASTIHSAIYGEPDSNTGEFGSPTTIKNSVVIIDESSMINKDLMADLITSARNNNNVLVFMGDGFQLEQIGEDSGLFTSLTKAEVFYKMYSVRLDNSIELVDVKRQSLESNVLKVATAIRTDGKSYVPNESKDDFKVTSSITEFENNFKKAIANDEDVAIIVATNSERIRMNTLARNAKFGNNSANILNKKETIIAVANSNDYANSETFNIKDYKNFSEKFYLEVEDKNVPYDKPKKSTKYQVYLVTVTNDKGIEILMLFIPGLDRPSLYHSEILKAAQQSSPELYKSLDRFIISKKGELSLSPELVIGTYGYAMTAHKSQGSQWKKVFVNQNYVAPTWNAARWFYTAITRGAEEVEVFPTSSNTRVSYDKINNIIGVVTEKEKVSTITTLSVEKQNQQVENTVNNTSENTSQASQIYNLLEKGTAKGNVLVTAVYDKDAAKYAKENNGISSLSITGSNTHFGNPFSSDVDAVNKNNLIQTSSEKESVEKYIDWVINSNEERAKWIRKVLKDGVIKGKNIIYNKELNEASHANALDYLINNYNWNTSNSEEENISNTFDTDYDDDAYTYFNTTPVIPKPVTTSENVSKTTKQSEDDIQKVKVVSSLLEETSEESEDLVSELESKMEDFNEEAVMEEESENDNINLEYSLEENYGKYKSKRLLEKTNNSTGENKPLDEEDKADLGVMVSLISTLTRLKLAKFSQNVKKKLEKLGEISKVVGELKSFLLNKVLKKGISKTQSLFYRTSSIFRKIANSILKNIKALFSRQTLRNVAFLSMIGSNLSLAPKDGTTYDLYSMAKYAAVKYGLVDAQGEEIKENNKKSVLTMPLKNTPLSVKNESKKDTVVKQKEEKTEVVNTNSKVVESKIDYYSDDNFDKKESNSTKEETKITPVIPTGFEVIGKVRDQMSSSKTDSLLSYRNQWIADEGFVFYITSNKSNSFDDNTRTWNNVAGVGHFVIDTDMSGRQNTMFINPEGRLDEYFPVFIKDDANNFAYRMIYKKGKDIDLNNDKVVTPLVQFKLSNINWKDSRKIYKSSKEFYTFDNKPTGLLFGDQNKYGRFNGNSVVFIFEYQGKTVVRDFAGSINQIRKEAESIMNDYNISADNITIGRYDAGSFSAKPAAKNGKLDRNQWNSFNPSDGGSAMLIPLDVNNSYNTEEKENLPFAINNSNNNIENKEVSKNSNFKLSESKRNITPQSQKQLQLKYKKAIVVQSESELPIGIRNKISENKYEGKVKGVEHNGIVYMVANNIESVADAEKVFRHEYYGHTRLKEALGIGLRKLAISLFNNASPYRTERLNELSKLYFKKPISELTEFEKEEIAQEYIANIAEYKSKDASLWEKIKSLILNIFKSLGIKSNSVSDREIELLIKSVENGKVSGIKKYFPNFDFAMNTIQNSTTKIDSSTSFSLAKTYDEKSFYSENVKNVFDRKDYFDLTTDEKWLIQYAKINSISLYDKKNDKVLHTKQSLEKLVIKSLEEFDNNLSKYVMSEISDEELRSLADSYYKSGNLETAQQFEDAIEDTYTKNQIISGQSKAQKDSYNDHKLHMVSEGVPLGLQYILTKAFLEKDYKTIKYINIDGKNGKLESYKIYLKAKGNTDSEIETIILKAQNEGLITIKTESFKRTPSTTNNFYEFPIASVVDTMITNAESTDIINDILFTENSKKSDIDKDVLKEFEFKKLTDGAILYKIPANSAKGVELIKAYSKETKNHMSAMAWCTSGDFKAKEVNKQDVYVIFNKEGIPIIQITYLNNGELEQLGGIGENQSVRLTDSKFLEEIKKDVPNLDSELPRIKRDNLLTKLSIHNSTESLPDSVTKEDLIWLKFRAPKGTKYNTVTKYYKKFDEKYTFKIIEKITGYIIADKITSDKFDYFVGTYKPSQEEFDLYGIPNNITNLDLINLNINKKIVISDFVSSLGIYRTYVNSNIIISNNNQINIDVRGSGINSNIVISNSDNVTINIEDSRLSSNIIFNNNNKINIETLNTDINNKIISSSDSNIEITIKESIFIEDFKIPEGVSNITFNNSDINANLITNKDLTSLTFKNSNLMSDLIISDNVNYLTNTNSKFNNNVIISENSKLSAYYLRETLFDNERVYNSYFDENSGRIIKEPVYRTSFEKTNRKQIIELPQSEFDKLLETGSYDINKDVYISNLIKESYINDENLYYEDYQKLLSTSIQSYLADLGYNYNLLPEATKQEVSEYIESNPNELNNIEFLNKLPCLFR